MAAKINGATIPSRSEAPGSQQAHGWWIVAR